METKWIIIIACAVIVVLGVGGYFLWRYRQKSLKSKIYSS